MKILKPATPVYTVRDGNVCKGIITSYINGKGYLVSFRSKGTEVIKRDRLFRSIDEAIDDYQAIILREAARLEMQSPRKGAK